MSARSARPTDPIGVCCCGGDWAMARVVRLSLRQLCQCAGDHRSRHPYRRKLLDRRKLHRAGFHADRRRRADWLGHRHWSRLRAGKPLFHRHRKFPRRLGASRRARFPSAPTPRSATGSPSTKVASSAPALRLFATPCPAAFTRRRSLSSCLSAATVSDSETLPANSELSVRPPLASRRIDLVSPRRFRHYAPGPPYLRWRSHFVAIHFSPAKTGLPPCSVRASVSPASVV